MTEAEWLHADKPPGLLLGVLQGNFRRQITDRRLRLFICGCVRQLPEHLWQDDFSSLVDYAESFADGSISLDDVNAFRGRGEPRHSDDRSTRFKQCLQERLLAGRKLLWTMAAAQATDVVAFRGRFTLGRGGNLSSILRAQSQSQPMMEGRRFISSIVRDIFGNPFRLVPVSPSWLTSTVVALATGMYQERAFDRMPILADALQDAGCDNEDILSHCRSEGPHVRGCWVVDLLTGRK